jgi:protein required for attachment to host cells
MPTTWVIAADGSRARIFEVSDDGKKLQEIEDMLNPEGRELDHEIARDYEGRFYGKGERFMAHTNEPDATPKQHKVELFSKHLSRVVDQARKEHRFDKLRLIAPAKFLGLIHHDLSKEAQKMIDVEIPKDISWFEGPDVERYVREHLH